MANANNQKITWDKDGSYQYWSRFQTMGLDPVGKVTVWHMSWSDLKAQCQLYRTALKNGNETEIKKYAQHIAKYIEWIRVAVLKGMDNADEAKMPVFKSPLEVEPARDGKPAITRVTPMLFRAGIERAKHMLLIDFGGMGVPHKMSAAEEITLRNLDRFAEMMIRSGRMGQEMTIDAAKTADPPTIFLKDGMKAGKLMSRSPFGNNEYDVKLGFEKNPGFAINGCLTQSQSKTIRNENGSKTLFWFSDLYSEMAFRAATEGTHGLAEEILAVKQEIPADLLARADQVVAEHQGLPEIISVLMKLTRTLENTRKSMMAEGEEVDNKAYKKAVEDTVRAKFKPCFAAITNAARHALKGLSPEDAALVVLATTFRTMGKNAKRPATFVATALEEEFLLLIASLCKEEPLAKQELVNASHLADGAEVEFVDGAEVGGKAFTDASLQDGIYTIRRHGRKVYACRKVADIIRASIPEEISTETVFQTLSFKTKEEAKAFDERIRRGKKVTLVPVNKDLGLSDAVVVDGVLAGHFDNKVTPAVYLMTHKTLPRGSEQGQKAMASPAVNFFYGYVQGSWLASEMNEIRNDAGIVTGYNVFVALKGVEKTFAPNFRKEYPQVTVAPEAAAQKAPKKSASNRAEALFGGQKVRDFGKSNRNPFAETVAASPAKKEVIPPPTDADAVFGQFAGMKCNF